MLLVPRHLVRLGNNLCACSLSPGWVSSCHLRQYIGLIFSQNHRMSLCVLPLLPRSPFLSLDIFAAGLLEWMQMVKTSTWSTVFIFEVFFLGERVRFDFRVSHSLVFFLLFCAFLSENVVDWFWLASRNKLLYVSEWPPRVFYSFKHLSSYEAIHG